VQNADLPLTDQANNSRRKRNRAENKNIELEEFRRKYLGIDPVLSVDQRLGELTTRKTIQKSPPEPPQQAAPPTATELRTTGFGQTSKDQPSHKRLHLKPHFFVSSKAAF
jgi:hypothetical protein